MPEVITPIGPLPPDSKGLVGQSGFGTGVKGTSGTGDGVYGESVDGNGVHGKSSNASGSGVWGENAGGDGVRGTSQSTQHAGVSASNSSTGGCGLWAKANTAGYFESTGGWAIQVVSKVDADGINVSSHSGGHAAVSGTNDGGGSALWGAAPGGVGVYARGDKQAALFDGKLQVNGDGLVSGTLTVGKDIVLSAADCAEEFDIAASPEIEPGTVMVLTDSGALEPSRNAYDKKVAGIISGAGDYRPGMVLDRQASSENRMPVALMGKVYCKVDAQYGPIGVGDLLTASPTAGHAMRASDPLGII